MFLPPSQKTIFGVRTEWLFWKVVPQKLPNLSFAPLPSAVFFFNPSLTWNKIRKRNWVYILSCLDKILFISSWVTTWDAQQSWAGYYTAWGKVWAFLLHQGSSRNTAKLFSKTLNHNRRVWFVIKHTTLGYKNKKK